MWVVFIIVMITIWIAFMLLSNNRERHGNGETGDCYASSGRSLRSFPPELESEERFSELRWLVISSNRISALPLRMGNLVGLEWINLHDNKLVSLRGIEQLRNLRILTVSKNRLTSLEGVENLEHLEVLDAFDNEIAVLPSGIGAMKGLKKINVGDNMLEALPSSLGNLKYLQELSLQNNRITHLPSSFSNLRRSTKMFIDLRDNPLSEDEAEGMLCVREFEELCVSVTVLFDKDT